jgi:hypothetical protein
MNGDVRAVLALAVNAFRANCPATGVLMIVGLPWVIKLRRKAAAGQAPAAERSPFLYTLR